MKQASPNVPKGLQAAGMALWSSIVPTYQLRPDEMRVLEDACREADWIDRLEAELADAEMVVKGSQGQPVANPLLSEIRQHRQVLKGMLSSLKLPDADGADLSNASEAGRALVNNRWRRSG